ncbi:hypothetical protein BconGalA64_08050 [Burkholderia contaminans]|nr:hypothetical protein BconGalA64_08050 [Burkholderia contaminans]
MGPFKKPDCALALAAGGRPMKTGLTPRINPLSAQAPGDTDNVLPVLAAACSRSLADGVRHAHGFNNPSSSAGLAAISGSGTADEYAGEATEKPDFAHPLVICGRAKAVE